MESEFVMTFTTLITVFNALSILLGLLSFTLASIALFFERGFRLYINLFLTIFEIVYLSHTLFLPSWHYSQGSIIVVLAPITDDDRQTELRTRLAANWGLVGVIMATVAMRSVYRYAAASRNAAFKPLFGDKTGLTMFLFPLLMGAFWMDRWYYSDASSLETKELIRKNILSSFGEGITDFEFLAIDTQQNPSFITSWWIMITSTVACATATVVFSVLAHRNTKIREASEYRMNAWKQDLMTCLIAENLGSLLLFFIPVGLLLSGNVIFADGLEYLATIATAGISGYLLFEPTIRVIMFALEFERHTASEEDIEYEAIVDRWLEESDDSDDMYEEDAV